MKVLVTGAGGQVGKALQATAPADTGLISASSAELDVTDSQAVREVIARERPELVFNAAAYTAVDAAEDDKQAAHAVNTAAVAHLAEACARTGARLVHISTDFVFDGTACRPYRPDATPNPISAYGRTKLAGEQAAGPDALILRTAWVYAAGGSNFVHTMLRLMATREEVRVVADQVGTPTWATSLAEALWLLANAGATGIQHYTDSGVASWYDFAVAINEEACAAGLLERPVRIVPIATADYPTPAVRPPYSVLDKSATDAILGVPAPHWRTNLRRMIREVAENG